VKKPLPEILRMPCGHKAAVEWNVCSPKTCQVMCSTKCSTLCCWVGPERKTARGAIIAWNRVARAAKKGA